MRWLKTAQLRNIVTCLLGYGLGLMCGDTPPSIQAFQAAAECTAYVPTAADVAAMTPQQRIVFMQTQKATQENVASAIRRQELIGSCEAAWALAPR